MRLRVAPWFLSLAFVALGYLSLNGCSPGLGHFNSLANQGILPLSSDNAHLGSNLFLAHEAQRSSYLMNFLKKRGGPSAIEILTEGRSRPTMVLFYPLKKEVFAADLDSTEKTYQWVVRGPFMMERQDYRDLNGMGVSFAAEPLFMISGQQTRFGAQPIETQQRALLPVVPTPQPTPVRKKPAVIHRPAIAVATPFKPMNSDQQAISLSEGFAERAENGDVIHTVQGAQTIDEISRWYTGAPGNSAMIMEKSGIPAGTPIIPGMRLRVPFASVKQFRLLGGKAQ